MSRAITVIAEWLALLAFLAVLVAGVAAFAWWDCHARWDEAGFPEVRWQLPGGCQLKLKDGRWIPAKNYREL